MSRVKKGLVSSVLLLIDSLLRKLVGLLSTLILARVLAPDDFGLVAIAALIASFLNTFSNTGASDYIVRARRPTRSLLNTAFAINVCIRLALAIILVVITPSLVQYYGDNKLASLLYVYAVILIIEGLTNPAVSLLRRRQSYSAIVKVTVIVKVISAIIAVGIALVYENYWALVVGTFVSTFLQVIGGYIIYPYFPKLEFKNAKEQWSFSGWLIPQSILGFFRTQFDTLLASSQFGQSTLGSYNTMKYMAFIPSFNLITPLTTPLLAQLAPLRDNKPHFTVRLNVATMVTMAISTPTAVFLYYYADSLILLLMGEQWIEYAKLFGLFSLLIPASSIYQTANRTLLIFARTRFTFFYEVVCGVILISALVLIPYSNVFEFLQIKILLEILLSLAYLIFAYTLITNMKNIVFIITAITIITAMSMLSAFASQFLWPGIDYLVVDLLLSGAIFAVFFICQFLLLIFYLNRTFEETHYLKNLLSKIWTVYSLKIKSIL
jgi:O-antigen/teichoic acid export membrane protein